jgi:hypothetical protein
MSARIDPEALADAILSAGEPDVAQYDAWTLDELDQFADFGLVRAARLGDDEQDA